MRVLLISLQDLAPARVGESGSCGQSAQSASAVPSASGGPAESLSRVRAAHLEEEQSLALARAMRDGGRLAPMLVCLKHSRLHQRALELGLPALAVSGAGARNPVTLLRLWRWQRRHKKLLVQTVGQEALALGRRMLRMRPAGSTLLAHAFFLRPPATSICNSREMLAAHKVLCGSEYVRRRLEQAQNQINSQDGTPCTRFSGEPRRALPFAGERLNVLPPGICLEGFTPVPLWQGSADTHAVGPTTDQTTDPAACAKQHFIFGMTDGLTPRSGAQLVVRSMSAIWQRTDLPPWEVRILGGGPRFNEVLEEAVGLGVESRLCLLNEQHLPDVLARCHAWIVPGSSPEELPETFWAGFAAHLPVICSRSELHMERLAGQADAALVVEENDPQALAKAMIEVMQSADLRQSLRERGAGPLARAGFEAMAEGACRLYAAWFCELGWLMAPENPPDHQTPPEKQEQD